MPSFIKTNYILIIILTISTVLSFLWLFLFNKEKLKAKTWEIVLVSILHTLFGVGFVKFFAIIEAGFNADEAGAMSLYGGIFFMPILYFAYAKIKKLPVGLVFDIFAVCLVGTLFLARINCLFMGCCLGAFIDKGYTIRFPSREMELVVNSLFVAFAVFANLKDKFNAKIFPFYLVYYGFFRFIIEFFRESDAADGPFHIAHVWSIISFFVGLLILGIQWVLEKKEQNNNSVAKKK